MTTDSKIAENTKTTAVQGDTGEKRPEGAGTQESERGRKLQIFMPMEPPRATAQEKRHVVTKTGRHLVYESERLKKAHNQLRDALIPHKPETAYEGPIKLEVCWFYKAGTKKQIDTWKITRPDTDNLDKMLKDIMTEIGFWNDDAQVCVEHIAKVWSVMPGLGITLQEITQRYTDGDYGVLMMN